AERSNVVLFDWKRLTKRRPELLTEDRVHATPHGYAVRSRQLVRKIRECPVWGPRRRQRVGARPLAGREKGRERDRLTACPRPPRPPGTAATAGAATANARTRMAAGTSTTTRLTSPAGSGSRWR